MKIDTNFEICMGAKLKHGNDYICAFVGEPLNSIQKVIFNEPATIVFWADGTKTVVKAGEKTVFDPEKGLAMAIAKKFLGNKGSYYEAFRKHLNEAGIDDVNKKYIKLLNDLTHCEIDLYNCKLYLDRIFELFPEIYDRMMNEFSGMPCYVFSKSSIRK